MGALRVSLHLMGALTGHPRWPLGKVLPAAWGGSAHIWMLEGRCTICGDWVGRAC
jgi:hypothetical protein